MMSLWKLVLVAGTAMSVGANAAEPMKKPDAAKTDAASSTLVPGLPIKLADPPKDTAEEGSTKDALGKLPPLMSAGAKPAAPVLAAVGATPSTPVPSAANDPLALRGMVEAARLNLTSSVKPPPHDITVKPGVTEIIPISIGRVNRIITPFPDPVIRANRPREEISRTGNIITVATGSTDDVSLFAWDRSDPQTSISVQLLPRDIPPVEVKLDIAGWQPVHPAAPAEEGGTAWETEQPFVESIKTLFRDLAQGKVPSGFGLDELRGKSATDMPRCRWPGVSLHVAQRLEGHVMVALVARAVNTSIEPIELDESACAAPQVLAVAAWPRSRLEPGEETEVYVAVRRPSADSASQRPSVLRQESR